MSVGVYIFVIGLAVVLLGFGIGEVAARIIMRREYRSGYVDTDEGSS